MPIRVLVVEDSLTVRKRLVEMLAVDPAMAVVGEAEDGKQAIELCETLRPDVVSLDLMLPVMSGVAVTEYVMAYFPTPILVVSASTNRGELYRTYDALAAGAIEVLEKPRGDTGDEAWARRYRELLKLVSRIKVITHPRARLESLGKAAPSTEVPRRPRIASGSRVVAIGASTGGPGAIVEILRALPPSFPLPLLLVLHIAPPFDTALPEWIEGQSRFEVAYVRDGDRLPRPGRVAMAPADRHLIVSGGRLRLTTEPPRHSCRPSIDSLFETLAHELGEAAIGCLLTGMGRDGAEGLLAIRRAGGLTIAQDEATSVVFGMPREAIASGAAIYVLPLGAIGAALIAAAGMEASES